MFTLVYKSENNEETTYEFNTKEEVEVKFKKINQSYEKCIRNRYFDKNNGIVIDILTNPLDINTYIISAWQA